MSKLIKVGITQGDFNGIGPEIIVRALADEGITELFTPVVFADWRIMEHARKEFCPELRAFKKADKAADSRHGQINVVDLNLDDITITAGTPTQASGTGAVAALEKAVAALQNGEIDVLVTAPISKEAVQSETFKFPGHTEYLNSKAGNEFRARMILFADSLRVALVTTHLPIANLAESITREGVAQAIRDFSDTLTRDFSVTRPKIAVLSLNPHSGDGGLLGSDENDKIKPAIEDCIESGILAFGPYAADGFFGNGAYRNFDGVLAMYHDQGLGPFKALASEKGVNYTAGLPFVRTSPDHGTAYDIAWKGQADPQSMREAIYKAIDIYRCRSRHDEAASNVLRKQMPENRHKAEKPNDKNEKTLPEKEGES